MYADNITGSMKNAVAETNRRRKLQTDFNSRHNIIPRTISKNISDILFATGIKSKKEARRELAVKEHASHFDEDRLAEIDFSRIDNIISGLEEEMHLAAAELNFEKAADIRDEIKRIRKIINP